MNERDLVKKYMLSDYTHEMKWSTEFSLILFKFLALPKQSGPKSLLNSLIHYQGLLLKYTAILKW